MNQTKTRLTRPIDLTIAFSFGVAVACLFFTAGLAYEENTQDAVSVPRGQLVQLIGMAEYAVMAPYDSEDSPPTDADRDLMLSLHQLIDDDVPDYSVNVVRLQADDPCTARPAE